MSIDEPEPQPLLHGTYFGFSQGIIVRQLLDCLSIFVHLKCHANRDESKTERKRKKRREKMKGKNGGSW